MKYNLNISKDAKGDLKEIYKYIAFELLSPDAAIKQLDRIEKAIYSLNDMPARHRVYDEKINPYIRFLMVDNYCVFYIVNEEDFEVNIVHIFYGSRNHNDIL